MTPTTPFLEQWKKDAQKLHDRIAEKQPKVRPTEIVECVSCGADVEFGDCCNECDYPTDH